MKDGTQAWGVVRMIWCGALDLGCGTHDLGCGTHDLGCGGTHDPGLGGGTHDPADHARACITAHNNLQCTDVGAVSLLQGSHDTALGFSGVPRNGFGVFRGQKGLLCSRL